MKFSYAIGNPPYQEQVGSGSKPIWPAFVLESTKIADKSCMIHPGRWLQSEEGLYKKIHDDLINAKLSIFDYFPKSEDIFPNVAIDNGVSITLFDMNKSNDDVMYKINNVAKGKYVSTAKFFSSPLLEECYNKVFSNINVENNMSNYVIDVISSGHAERFIKNKDIDTYILTSPEGLDDYCKIWASKTFGKGGAKYDWYYIDKSNIVNLDIKPFMCKKLMISATGHSIAHGKGNGFNNIPQIIDEKSIGFSAWFLKSYKLSSEINKINEDHNLILLKSLFMTKTARFLMSITQSGLFVCGFENIPDYLELAKLLPENELFTDEWFYKTFDFSEGLINEIETKVSPKVEKSSK